MVGWIVFAAYVVAYSVGMAVYLKRRGYARWALALIPFVSFFFVDRVTGGFKILSIAVRKWGKTVVILTVISLCAYLYGLWGLQALDAEQSAMLVQCMWLPAGASILIFWLGNAYSAVRILFLCRAGFRCDLLVCLLFVPVPVVLAAAGRGMPAKVRQTA